MGARTKDVINEINRDNIPGPGQYDVQNASVSVTKNEPAFSLGTGSRSDLANFKEHKNKPGPGAYQQEIDMKKSAPKYGFGTG